jgi:tryptophan-rich sensory protein
MTQTTEYSEKQEKQENKEETLGGYISNLILSMLFPFLAIFYGPKYLFGGQIIKGVVLIVIVVAELYYVNTVFLN